MKPKFGNPTDQRAFEALCARAARQGEYQRLLWRRLRAMMAEGRKDQGGAWRERFIKLLERAARHERLKDRTYVAGCSWIDGRGFRPKRPMLRLLRGGKQ